MGPWNEVIWFKHHVSARWAIVQWMAVLGSLSTKDRMENWG